MITALPPQDLVLETARLWLRPMTLADEDIACAVLCDPDVMHYVGDAITPEEVRDHMPDAARRGAGGRIGIWCAVRKDTGDKIGDGVLTPVPIDLSDTDWSLVVPEAYPAAEIEVGYLLIPAAWGQGFATEICARLLQFAFEQTALDEVVATTDPENARSQNVLQKCGLRPLGLRRAYGHDDVSWFAVNRVQWQARGAVVQNR